MTTPRALKVESEKHFAVGFSAEFQLAATGIQAKRRVPAQDKVYSDMKAGGIVSKGLGGYISEAAHTDDTPQDVAISLLSHEP